MFQDDAVYLLGSAYVGVVVRDFIEGEAPSNTWHLMTWVEKERLCEDFVVVVYFIADVTSPVFGILHSRSLATANPCRFLS